MTHSRPLAESNARRRPTGKCSMASFAPRCRWQKRQTEYNAHPKTAHSGSTARVTSKWSTASNCFDSRALK